MIKNISLMDDGSRVYQYRFNNIIELVDYVSNADVNTRVFDIRSLSSKRTTDYHWYRTKNFDEAIDYCLHGDNEAIRFFNSSNQEVELMFPVLSKKRNIVEDYYGHRVDVNKYLTSNPRCMYRLDRNEKFNIIEIYFNVSAIATNSGDMFFNRGVATINLIKLLENLGYRVALNFVNLAQNIELDGKNNLNKEIFYFLMNIKRADEKISPAICCFPMCNPSFLRRIIFRVRETTDFKILDWGDGYGNTMSLGDMKTFFEQFENKDMTNCIIIGDPRKMGIRGENLEDDIINFFNAIDINKYISGVNLEYDEVKKEFSLKRKK